MANFLNILVLLIFSSASCPQNDVANVKVTCDELGLSIMLPAGFTSLDSSKINALSKRGEKAVTETFDKESLHGWQPVCFNLQDSFKRSVLTAAITIREAIALNGSADKFIDQTFKDGNDFIIQRFKRRASIAIDEKETAKQSEITIAGLKVRKNAFTLVKEGQLLFFARYYFFAKNEKLYLLNFLGSAKASDNEDIVNAIESAKKL
jgi:hypothetical protein